MTELQIMLAVANDQRVRRYRRAVQIMHNRMVGLYGENYADDYDTNARPDVSPVGVTRMTPQHAELFASLMRGAAIIRKAVRAEILASA